MADLPDRVIDRIDTSPRYTEADAIRLNNMFRGRDTVEMLETVLKEQMLGDVAAVSSFGAESVVLLHMVSVIDRTLPVSPLPLLIDVLDDDPARHSRLSWRQAITHQVSQTCAAYFDRAQADWQPERSRGLYAFWRDTLTHDHGIGILMGLPDLGRALAALPQTRQDAEQWVLQRLGLPDTVWADYLEAVLLTVNGWASWCAYLNWQAGLEGRSDEHLRELLVQARILCCVLCAPTPMITCPAVLMTRGRLEAQAWAVGVMALSSPATWQVASRPAAAGAGVLRAC